MKIQPAISGSYFCFWLCSPWSCVSPRSSKSNFYALIGQNLTGELMLKIYAASWILLLWQLKLTEFCVNLWCFKLSFSTGYEQNELQLLSGVFCYSWLVCLLGFWSINTSLVIVGNPMSDGIVFVFHLAWCVKRVEKSEAILAYLKPFRSCISNGKPE